MDQPIPRMKKLWVYNYNFEFELAGHSPIQRASSKFAPWFLLNRSSSLYIPLMDSQDQLLTYQKPSDLLLQEWEKQEIPIPRFLPLSPSQESNAVLQDLENELRSSPLSPEIHLSPWGWSPHAYQFDQHLKRHQPYREEIKEWNSKIFSAQLRQQTLSEDYQIPCQILNLSSLSLESFWERALSFVQKNSTSTFFLKHSLGTSGKFLDLVDSQQFPTPRTWKKWKRWSKEGGGVLLEKSLSIQKEWSLHFDLTKDSFPKKEKILPIGITQLFSGKSRNYQGTFIDHKDQSLLQKHIPNLTPLFQKFLQKEYTGPIGVDLLETESGEWKLLEINCRWTMGRIALAWHQKQNPYPYGLYWNHFSRNHGQSEQDLFQKIGIIQNRYPCKIITVNYIQDHSFSFQLHTFFLGAQEPNLLFTIQEEIQSL